MKFLYFILVPVLSLILMLAVSPLRAYPLGLGYASIAGFIAFFFLTVFCFKIFKSKLPEWQILVALILGFWFLQLPIRINDSSVIILAVDKPIEEDKPNEAFDIIKREGYTFPVAIAADEEMPEKFGVKVIRRLSSSTKTVR